MNDDDDVTWVSRCVERLKSLRPDIGEAEAWHIARSAASRTSGMTPEMAAQFFARHEPARRRLH